MLIVNINHKQKIYKTKKWKKNLENKKKLIENKTSSM